MKLALTETGSVEINECVSLVEIHIEVKPTSISRLQRTGMNQYWIMTKKSKAEIEKRLEEMGYWGIVFQTASSLTGIYELSAYKLNETKGH